MVSPETTLLEAARRAGYELGSVCSGQGACGECRLRVLEGEVSGLTGDEGEWLGRTELLDGVRLGCCTRVRSPLRVRLEAKHG